MPASLARILKILAELKGVDCWEELLGGKLDEELVEEEEEEVEKVVDEEEEVGGDDDGGDSSGGGQTDERIEYEKVDGKKVETDFSMDRSRWFKPIEPVPEQLI
ncbi:hypothetical protein L1987_46542 [Smallanthus sonchifolius]|uniref:Uncharacterized protein n=1 Tax=Smallanthus sonchifolius TaxID=185202 RepID=A0ACB9FZX9_9ASTR|nr:hypothetical protein L1987_46542 [Smallanthus sonchifolius]